MWASNRIRSFCAFCQTPRRIYRKRRVSAWDFFSSALGALVLMGFVFQDWDARVFLFFTGFLALSEMIIQIRWRLTVVCPECGFDPVLYLRKPELAAEKVTRHLEKRKQDPAALLKPPVRLPARREKKENLKGTRLSKQV